MKPMALVAHHLKDDGRFPNNPMLPLLIYQKAVRLQPDDPGAVVESIFLGNGWSGLWRSTIYAYHHYHSTAHEVLGVYRGEAEIQVGGDAGPICRVATGDVIIIPAGVAHRNLDAEETFRVVGGYPKGQMPDMCRGRQGERPAADCNIARVPVPDRDPVFGMTGPLLQRWRPDGGASGGRAEGVPQSR